MKVVEFSQNPARFLFHFGSVLRPFDCHNRAMAGRRKGDLNLFRILVVIRDRAGDTKRLLEMFRQIMEDFGDKLVSGVRQVVDRHETVVNRSEVITSRQEAVVSRLEAMAQGRWRGGADINGKH